MQITKNKFKIIKNRNINKNVWKHDPNISDEEVDIWNNIWHELSETVDPRFKTLIWHRKKQIKKKLKL